MAASAYREVHSPTAVSASHHGAFERLERCEGKLSRTVPRGRRAGNSPLLPDRELLPLRILEVSLAANI